MSVYIAPDAKPQKARAAAIASGQDEEDEMNRQKKLEGTAVTVEAFVAWRVRMYSMHAWLSTAMSGIDRPVPLRTRANRCRSTFIHSPQDAFEAELAAKQGSAAARAAAAAAAAAQKPTGKEMFMRNLAGTEEADEEAAKYDEEGACVFFSVALYMLGFGGGVRFFFFVCVDRVVAHLCTSTRDPTEEGAAAARGVTVNDALFADGSDEDDSDFELDSEDEDSGDDDDSDFGSEDESDESDGGKGKGKKGGKGKGGGRR